MRGDKVEQTALRDDVDELAGGVDDGDATRARVLARREHHGDVEQRGVGADLDERRATRQIRQCHAIGDDELIVRA